jgi:hypothetical protein
MTSVYFMNQIPSGPPNISFTPLNFFLLKLDRIFAIQGGLKVSLTLAAIAAGVNDTGSHM